MAMTKQINPEVARLQNDLAVALDASARSDAIAATRLKQLNGLAELICARISMPDSLLPLLFDWATRHNATRSHSVPAPVSGVTAKCRNCGCSIRLHKSGMWVHDDEDEDPESYDYGWVGCVIGGDNDQLVADPLLV